MSYEVRIGEDLAAAVTHKYGHRRSTEGTPSEWDFWSGPLKAACIRFRDFDSLRPTHIPLIRTLHIVDPVFGPVVFVGVLVDTNVVEIAEFALDPDYWSIVEDDPDD